MALQPSPVTILYTAATFNVTCQEEQEEQEGGGGGVERRRSDGRLWKRMLEVEVMEVKEDVGGVGGGGGGGVNPPAGL